MTCLDQIIKAHNASREFHKIKKDVIEKVLNQLADAAVANTDFLLSENQKDLDNMPESDPRYDRLKLSSDRIKAIASDIRAVAQFKSPVGEVIESRTTKTGLNLVKKRVPIGVVGIIYEARPNVTFDVFALCFRSGNCSVLKGGQDAFYSNKAIASVIHDTLKECSVSTDVLQLLPADRESAKELMEAEEYVDVLIPRGSKSLIEFVRKNSIVPVIETGAGVVHTYFHSDGDLSWGKKIITNAKTRRTSVCNALECLIVHYHRLEDLPELLSELPKTSVILEADTDSYEVLNGKYPSGLLLKAKAESFGKEHLASRLSVKTVKSLEEAIEHINRYGTKHSEAIVTSSESNASIFCDSVDAAAVYVNTSTAFTDGAQFEMGAEMGISTQKLHVRGPIGLKELTSYKWIITSDGITRA